MTHGTQRVGRKVEGAEDDGRDQRDRDRRGEADAREP